MIVSEQLNYIKTRRFHAIFMSVIIEFSRCIGTYSSAKFESFNKLHLMTEDRNREFDFYEVHWPFPIDMTKFALEEIDF